MFERLDTNQPKMTKEQYKPRYDELIKKLVVLQQEAAKREIGVVVLFEGWKGAGKGSRISDLIYRLDARGTTVHVTQDFDFGEANETLDPSFDAIGFHPPMQQFWEALGSRDAITVFDRGWYYSLVEQVVHYAYSFPTRSAKQIKKSIDKAMKVAFDEIQAFEKQLADDGYIILKFFLHISEEMQYKRLSKLRNDPSTRWRVTDHDLAQIADYNKTYELYDRLLDKTDFPFSPWTVMASEDKRRINLEVVSQLVDVLETELNRQPDPDVVAAQQKALDNSSLSVSTRQGDERALSVDERSYKMESSAEQARLAQLEAPYSTDFPIVKDYPRLADVDHSLFLTEEEYKRQLKKEQRRLHDLEITMYLRRVPLMIMYEGWDAAGKGGSIKRVAQALDARSYNIFTSPAPTKAELAHPFLWRYWTRLPKAGHVGIYDRSWYGRVLVERVEGFASSLQWSRAYDEINQFEKSMYNWGAILLKFWVDVSQDVQLQRFEERQQNPAKRWKITAEDWRNRDRYPEYYAAVEDMFRLTSTEYAPWIILESDNKYYARIKALKTINEALEKRLNER